MALEVVTDRPCHRRTVNELIPRGSYGTADDIAGTVVHLAGPAGRNINAANTAIDGGITA